MEDFNFHICFFEGMEIILRHQIFFYFHSKYSLISPSKIYPKNYKTDISKNLRTAKEIIHSITYLTNHLIVSKPKTIIINYEKTNTNIINAHSVQC